MEEKPYNSKEDSPVIPANGLGDPYSDHEPQKHNENNDEDSNTAGNDEGRPFINISFRRWS